MLFSADYPIDKRTVKDEDYNNPRKHLDNKSLIYSDSEKFLFEYLENKGVDAYTNAKVLELKDHAVVIEKEGKTEEIGGFTDIVIAVGGKSENPLEEKLAGKVELSVIGDAKSVRQGIDAVHEGYEAGYNI